MGAAKVVGRTWAVAAIWTCFGPVAVAQTTPEVPPEPPTSEAESLEDLRDELDALYNWSPHGSHDGSNDGSNDGEADGDGLELREPEDPRRRDTCDPWANTEEARPLGFSLQLATGYQRAAQPLDHLAFALGVEGELLVVDWLSAAARMTWITGGDAGSDRDGDGLDDEDSDNAHLLVLTGGPRVRLWSSDEEPQTAWELDLGAGYAFSLSGIEKGEPVLEVGLGHTWMGAVGLGARFLSGASGDDAYRAVLLRLSLGPSSVPPFTTVGGCPGVGDEAGPSLPWAMGVHLPLLGAGLSEGLGLMVPGIALEAVLQVSYPIDVVARVDYLYFAGNDRDGITLHSGLLGLRAAPLDDLPLVFTALGGYTKTYGTAPRVAYAGPVVDAGVRYDLLLEQDGSLFLGLNTRLGVTGDNRRLRGLFLTLGLEFRSDEYEL